MSFMEEQFMNRKSPLYGRRTCQYKIKPFDFWETKQFCPGFSPEDLAVVFGITGGIPMYLSLMDSGVSLKENICRQFLLPSSFLREEPYNLINQECRNASDYNGIIAALAGGATRISEISDRVSSGQSLIADYLRKLMALGIVQKEVPYGALKSKKSIYSLEDTMFRFWYRFIPYVLPRTDAGLAESAYRSIEPHLSEFMGPIFEKICRQYLWRKLVQGKCPVDFRNLGRWWGTDQVRRCSAEIDIMGDDGAGTALFAGCKWKNEPVDLSVAATLRQRANLFDYGEYYLFLFSKTGFTKRCADLAERDPHLNLVDFTAVFRG